MAAEILGNRLYITAYALDLRPAVDHLPALLQGVVNLIGMDTGGMQPQVWAYPLPDGRGGLGETICQPLVESFLVADTWPALERVYVVLASCRPYHPEAVAAYLEKEIGPVLKWGRIDL